MPYNIAIAKTAKTIGEYGRIIFRACCLTQQKIISRNVPMERSHSVQTNSTNQSFRWNEETKCTINFWLFL